MARKLRKFYSLNSFFMYQQLFVFIVFCNFVGYRTCKTQTIFVSGKVMAGRVAVQNAVVTFINNSDTTKQYQVITDQFGNYSVGIVTSVSVNNTRTPLKFNLYQNYPNPFSSSTIIPIEIRTQSHVQVRIFDILGRLVRSFDLGVKSMGRYTIVWDSRNDVGIPVASGIYFCVLVANGETQIRKLILRHEGKFVVDGTISSTNELLNFSLPQLHYAESSQRTFTVRVDNSSSTVPYIETKILKDVTLIRDTTINLSVNYIPMMVIDQDSVRQLIRGFGAANIVGWRPDMTSDEIEKAFGTGDGQIGLSILRLRISPNPSDWANNVPSAKAAYEKGVTLIASPWSPPASMKTNNDLVGGQLKEENYESYATHLKSFVEYMASQGAPIYAVSIQNEPDYKVTYESCDWYAYQMINFLKGYGKSLGTKVMAPESFQFRRQLSDSILNDPIACSNLDIVCGHIYGGGLFSYPLAEEKDKEVWMTEHLTSSNETTNPQAWSLAFPVAKEINDVMKARMSAYVWWYIVRFYGPISDGTNNSGYKGTVTKKGYVMSQFARFIRPGYRMIDAKVYPSIVATIDGSAYKDPNTNQIVIVALNSASTQQECVFRVPQKSILAITPYTTTATKNCECGTNFFGFDGVFRYTLEPLSVTTFVIE